MISTYTERDESTGNFAAWPADTVTRVQAALKAAKRADEAARAESARRSTEQAPVGFRPKHRAELALMPTVRRIGSFVGSILDSLRSPQPIRPYMSQDEIVIHSLAMTYMKNLNKVLPRSTRLQ